MCVSNLLSDEETYYFHFLISAIIGIKISFPSLLIKDIIIFSIMALHHLQSKDPQKGSLLLHLKLHHRSTEGFTTPSSETSSPSIVEGSTEGFTTPSSETSSPSIVEGSTEGFTTPSSETSSPSIVEGSTEGFTTPSSETSSPSIVEGSSTPLISGSSSIPISTVSSSMTTNGIITTIQPGGENYIYYISVDITKKIKYITI
uniref:REJ domain-containing protein n=1 Tax=Heterorhabditis bacteriophora TaxID=37862 RepID=A0A1I7WI76_HETBA